jgi:hypothetical protein
MLGAAHAHLPPAACVQDSEGRSKGCGIIEFESPSDALHAISQLSNTLLGGRQIMVREDREDPGLAAVARRGATGAEAAEVGFLLVRGAGGGGGGNWRRSGMRC